MRTERLDRYLIPIIAENLRVQKKQLKTIQRSYDGRRLWKDRCLPLSVETRQNIAITRAYIDTFRAVLKIIEQWQEEPPMPAMSVAFNAQDLIGREVILELPS